MSLQGGFLGDVTTDGTVGLQWIDPTETGYLVHAVRFYARTDHVASVGGYWRIQFGTETQGGFFSMLFEVPLTFGLKATGLRTPIATARVGRGVVLVVKFVANGQPEPIEGLSFVPEFATMQSR